MVQTKEAMDRLFDVLANRYKWVAVDDNDK